MTNKQRHLVEIGQDVRTAVIITHHEDGQIGVTSPKGSPHMMEIAALTFGVFVSFIKGAEHNGLDEMSLIRKAFAEHSLEEMCEQLLGIAQLVSNMEKKHND